MKKIIVLFSGTASNLENIILSLHNKKLQIIATITNNYQANGINISKKHNIECNIIDDRNFKPKEYNENLNKCLNNYTYDLIVLAGYMRIFPKWLIKSELSKNVNIINIHPSFLPKHKGLNGALRSYRDDSNFGGVSVHHVVEEIDSGEIILQKKIDKTNIHSFAEYEKEVKKLEFDLFPKAICEVLNL